MALGPMPAVIASLAPRRVNPAGTDESDFSPRTSDELDESGGLGRWVRKMERYRVGCNRQAGEQPPIHRHEDKTGSEGGHHEGASAAPVQHVQAPGLGVTAVDQTEDDSNQTQ